MDQYPRVTVLRATGMQAHQRAAALPTCRCSGSGRERPWGRGSAFRLLRQLRGFDGLVGGGGDVLRDDRGWRHLSFATEKYFVASRRD
jgi:hypothetical protein